MLTADLAVVRKRAGELHPGRLRGRTRDQALLHAEALLGCARDMVGGTRDDLDEAFAALDDAGLQRRVALGLRKLVVDACTFEAEPPVAASELRERVFTLASATRRALPDGATFDRAAVLAEAAASLEMTAEAVEAALFSDLRGAQALLAGPTPDAPSIVDAWEAGQIQAVLLRAVRVVLTIKRASPGALRTLLSRIKFHGLCWMAKQRDDKAIELTIDGPMSLFESVTKYGLRLAMLVPALAELDDWELVADVRWGRERDASVMRAGPGDLRRGPKGAPRVDEPHLSDTARELLEDLLALAAADKGSPLTVCAATTILDVPGVGICVPDLELRRADWAAPVFVEVLGFWSRDAVWRRVELVQAGLGARIVLCASERLRVKDEVLAEDESGSLYMFKGKPRAKTVLERAERLATR
ncbi:MAG: DUF790 family protein [Myxococcales bacterium]|nr:DUF790 family protein [Myxococcales bacterium]